MGVVTGGPREHGICVADLLIHHRVDPLGAALGSGGMQQQDGRAFEVASYVTTVATELVDHLRVLGVHLLGVECHALHVPTSGSRWQSTDTSIVCRSRARARPSPDELGRATGRRG
jgi:hypothetical protein